ncbi:ATP-binding protein [Leptolyngbya sp. FACHB-261]|uniref:ATP-binding protein n=1 Tax=Leptolyngbya sp. FACHB-261 TaxID=2692806 RepID=UPI001F556642|nr:ATP-binding protein [Leptolyngbya sp. FACHB-261]
MSLSLAERLRAERHQRFVGRALERQLFQSALVAAELPFHVLHVFGPGGVGKTTLLREFVRLCEQAQVPAFYVDARNLEASPDSFLKAVKAVMSSAPPELTGSSRQVILVDTYELIDRLDDWLRDEFLPQLPAQALIVLAGRHAPTSAWRSDPGWQAIVQVVPLRNLSPEESRAYLTRREVPSAEHQGVLEFTHGHPLALSLVADVFAQGQDLHFQPEAAPDVVRTLLARFVLELPSPAHRIALEACALARLTTETLLAEMLGLPEVHELFQWLRSLSFIEAGRSGLFPHDLAREVLIADLRWRNPDWYTELHLRARTYYTSRLEQTRGQEQHSTLFDYIFLHRDNPAVRPRFTWHESSTLLTDRLREGDPPILVSMVAAHEGEASAQLAAHWLARQPYSVLVFRDGEGTAPVGFVMMLALNQTTPEERSVDPAAQTAWDYLQNHTPLRAGEGATLLRFWLAADTYQAVSPIQSLIFIHFVQYHRTTAGLAFTFFSCAEPDFWAAMFNYADLARLPEADFSVGERHYGMYGHDWRAVPPMAWQALLAQREIAASVQATATPEVSMPLMVLSQPAFVEAVREALRNFARADALRNNPLLQSRLVMEQVPAQTDVAERIAVLRQLIQSACESLQSSPREAKCYRALHRAYLQPAPTQEQAAELLDLPFSTFRRHLKTGMSQVADLLWHQEIG